MNIKQSTKETRVQKYSKLNERISIILARLYNGEILSMKELSTEFNINLRTIQRDINERLTKFPIKKDGDKFMLNWIENNDLNADDIAILEIIQEISKNQGAEFYKKANKLFNKLKTTQNPFYTKINIEDISDKLNYTILIENAIKHKNFIKITYNINTSYEIILKPLKILNFEGFWYLLALDNKKMKKYLLRKIENVEVLDKSFELSQEIEKSLDNAINVWFDIENEPFEVELFIEKNIANYFKVKPISKSQIIRKTYEDGSMDISVWITHYMEIFRIIKYWIPEMKVISPKWLDTKIKEDIKLYLGV